nr:hypothetical protein [uncultured Desulfobulbus sp.]
MKSACYEARNVVLGAFYENDKYRGKKEAQPIRLILQRKADLFQAFLVIETSASYLESNRVKSRKLLAVFICPRAERISVYKQYVQSGRIYLPTRTLEGFYEISHSSYFGSVFIWFPTTSHGSEICNSGLE